MLILCFVEVLVLLMVGLFLYNISSKMGGFGDNKSVQVGHMRGYFDKRLSAFSNNQQLGSLENPISKIVDTIKSSYNQLTSHL